MTETDAVTTPAKSTGRADPALRTDPAQVERELLARLGLTTQASSQDLETAHDEILKFLESAPHDLRTWAEREIGVADEAYALLSDPTTDLTAVAAASTGATAGAAPAARVRAARPAAAKPSADGDRQRSGRNPIVRRVVIVAAIVVGAVTVAFIGYNAGAPSVPGFTGTPAPEASSGTGIDQAQVVALMEKIQKDPKDVTSLQALGDLYFKADDYKTAGDFMTKILALDPKNLTALLALGAADFNQGSSAEAEKQWRAVLAIDPQNLEAHYDLGFMYFSRNPPDVANVKAEWNRVIEIAPDSAVAKTVATHLQSLEGSPAPSDAASPAASPAPSGS